MLMVYLTLRVYQCQSRINKLYLILKRMVACLVGVLRNDKHLGAIELHATLFLFDPFLQRSPSNTDEYFAAYAGVVVYHTGHPKYDLSVVSDLKTVRMPYCCRQRRRGPKKSFYDSRIQYILLRVLLSMFSGLWVLINLRKKKEG